VARNPLVNEMLKVCATLAHLTNAVVEGEASSFAVLLHIRNLQAERLRLSDLLSRQDLTPDERLLLGKAQMRVLEAAVALAEQESN